MRISATAIPGALIALRPALGAAMRGLALVGAMALPATAQAPLSAIDWLRDSVVLPEPGAHPVTPMTGDAWIDGVITMRPIDALRPESVGLFAAARVGLPRDIWGPTGADELAVLLRGLPADTLPALRALAYRLLLAEFDAPRAGSTVAAPAGTVTAPPQASAFLRARIDKLFEFGAIDQAAALLDTLDPRDAELRQHRFEIALLLGQESTACANVLTSAPPFTFEPGNIFCQARAGDWQGAVDRLRQGEAQGTIGALYGPLLARFLDVDDHVRDENAAQPDALVPSRLSPLSWRLLEAVGEPVASHGMPVAFAHADLRGTIGWRAQLEAAERLVRAGALPANQLLGLYTERSAAASGGIWERVRAVQRLDTALAGGDAAAVGDALDEAWPHVQAGELEVAFATLYAEPLRRAGLEGEAGELAFLVGLLSDDYEAVALGHRPHGANERFLADVARGLAPEMPAEAGDALRLAVAEAFAEPPPVPEATLARLSEGRLGEEILIALIRLGPGSDPRQLTEGLAVLRHVGLEDIARRAALQALLLERRG